MTIRSSFKPVFVAAAMLTLSAPVASAAVVGFILDTGISLAAPYTIAQRDEVSYTFSDAGRGGRFFGFPIPAVSTTGSATVASLGEPFFDPPQPSTYFTDEGRRPFFDSALLGEFLSYDLPTAIEAEFDSYLGLRFELDDGVHFGFARVTGLSLFEFAYETEAGLGIQAGPGPYAAIPDAPSPVPLPASLPLAAAGLAVLAWVARRRAA